MKGPMRRRIDTRPQGGARSDQNAEWITALLHVRAEPANCL
jgi:hypothetical protein